MTMDIVTPLICVDDAFGSALESASASVLETASLSALETTSALGSASPSAPLLSQQA